MSARPSILATALVAGLTACGGAGVVQPGGYVYPELSAALPADTGSGLQQGYVLDEGTKQLTQAGAASIAAAVNTPGPDQITLSVNNLAGETFSVILPVSSLVTVTTPLVNSPIASGCAECLRVPLTPPIASDGKPVRFVYLDPAAAGLQYSTLGLWSKEKSSDDASSISNIFVGGAFSLGVLTRGSDLPLTGSASYAGPFVGRYVDATAADPVNRATYLVGADASASANFATRSVSFSTTSTRIARELAGGALAVPVAESRLDLSGTLSYVSASNLLAGSVATQSAPAGFAMSGSAQGAFYGPPASSAVPTAPAELGGTLSAGNVDGTRQLNGGFALKRQ